MSAPQTFRIFVSSPGDAHFERQRVDRVVARLNGELGGAARLSTVRWETEFYKADSTFQAQIPASVECNIVLAIFRARLGTELPTDFARMPDGDPYPSGSAYEVLTAIAKRQAGGDLPDVFVFRCSDPPLVRIDDRESEDGVRSDWSRLKAFFSRWFLSDDGHFRAAFQTFGSTDDFEAQVERLLRNWLQERLAKGGLVAWPVATRGSPYPGLQAFGPHHAPVFFGRARDTARAVETWIEAGRRGTPFLLVVGASGAGKSSLARAGLVPRLTTPGVVPAVDLWRVATMRPGESPGGPMAALAHALLGDDPARSGRDDGSLPPLPELARGDYATPAELAALLAHADASAVKPVSGALDKIGEAERRAQASDKPMRCDLVVVVDQLDELFAGTVDVQVRTTFANLLEALLATRRVWIVATLRADLYELFLRDETLLRLKTAGATYDLATPILADLAEAVRGPARAAELDWEVDAATGERLDDRLVGDIDRTDLLPIVQFVLDRLFQQRISRDGRMTMTHAAYQALGTLDGAIDTEAEAAVQPLGPAGIVALPRLLRSLVMLATPPGGARPLPTLRQAPRSAAAFDAAAAALVKALTDARILISGRDPAGTPVVALAHQRVIEAWSRARNAIAESADLIRVREDIEAARRRWEGAGQRTDLLIAPGLPLSEAENAAAALKDELPPDSLAFVARSGRAARLRHRLVAAAAVVFFAIAVGAAGLGLLAYREKGQAETATIEAEAQRNRAEAARVQADEQRQAADQSRALAVAQRQQADQARTQADARRREAEMRLAGADELLDGTGRSQLLRECLASTTRLASQPPPPASRDFFVGRWHVDQGFGSTDVAWNADGTCQTKNVFNGGPHALDLSKDVCTWRYTPVNASEFIIDYTSTQLGNDFPKRLHFRIVSPNQIHNVDYNNDAVRFVCPEQELTFDQARLASLRQQAAADVGNLARQHDLADGLQQFGNVLQAQGDDRGSLEALTEALTIRANLSIANDGNAAWRIERVNTSLQVAYAYLRLKQPEAGLAEVRGVLPTIESMGATSPGNALMQDWVASAYEMAGALEKGSGLDAAPALEYYRKAVAIRRVLAEAAPNDNVAWQALGRSLYSLMSVAPPDEARAAIEAVAARIDALEREKKMAPNAGWRQSFLGLLAQLPAKAAPVGDGR